MTKPVSKVIYKNPLEIRINKKFAAAFKMDKQNVQNITESMKVNGYDKEHPLVLWRTTGELADGHNRRQAAINAGLIRVPVIYKEFDSEKDLLDYISRNQLDRRNLTDKEKIQLIMNSTDFQNAKRKTEVVKNILHCSERTAAKYLSIIRNPAKLKAVMADKETVNTVTSKKTDNRTDIQKSVDRLSALLEKTDPLTDQEIQALDILFTDGRRLLRKMKSA